MQWFLITLALWLGVAEVHGGVLDSEISGKITIEDLNIIGIDNVDDISYKVSCETEFTDTSLIQGISLLKNIYDTEEVKNFISDDGGLSPCSATIDDEIKSMGGQNIGILLQGLGADNLPVIRGKTNKGIFPNFPTDPYQLTAATDQATMHLVRVSASNLGDLELEEDGVQLPVLGSSTTVTYYTKSANPVGSYKFCSTFDTTVVICDKTVGVTTDILETTGTVVSATLRCSSLEVQLEVSGFTGTALDVIHSNQICIGTTVNTATCPVTISGNEIVLDLIGLDGDTMKDHLNVIITDYHLIGQAIDSTSLEVRWDFQTGKTRYYIKHDQSGSGDFEAASVTCDGGGTDIPCFGYFTSLNPGNYIVSVQPKTGIPPAEDLDETNKIESEVINVVATKFSDRQVKHLQVNWHYNEQSGNINVCFLHASYNVERVFSHYEFVLINKTGQWLKHKLQTQDTEGDLCFSTFDVALQDFDASKGATLIVTQRAEDGFTVLASGKTSVTFI